MKNTLIFNFSKKSTNILLIMAVVLILVPIMTILIISYHYGIKILFEHFGGLLIVSLSIVFNSIIFFSRYIWQKNTPYILLTNDMMLIKRSLLFTSKILKNENFDYTVNNKFIEIIYKNKKIKIYFFLLDTHDKIKVINAIENFKSS